VRARPRSVARARSKIGGAEKGWRPSAGLTTSGGAEARREHEQQWGSCGRGYSAR
jgi:hypothetical protein